MYRTRPYVYFKYTRLEHICNLFRTLEKFENANTQIPMLNFWVFQL